MSSARFCSRSHSKSVHLNFDCVRDKCDVMQALIIPLPLRALTSVKTCFDCLNSEHLLSHQFYLVDGKRERERERAGTGLLVKALPAVNHQIHASTQHIIDSIEKCSTFFIGELEWEGWVGLVK